MILDILDGLKMIPTKPFGPDGAVVANHLVRGSTSDDNLLERLEFLKSAREAIGDDTGIAKLIDDLLEAASDAGKFA